MADAAIVWISLGGNLVTLLGGLFVAVRWFRHWFISNVSEPIERLEQTVSGIKTTATQALEQANRANQRLDKHLEASSNG